MNKNTSEYRTSDILALYGLSNKGLFYYEDKGLITPKRAQESNYRVYTLTETARLHRCRIFRQYGFSVDDSIDLVLQCDPEKLNESYKRRKDDIERDITWSRMLIERLDYDSEAVRLISEGRVPLEIIMRPEMCRVRLRDVGDIYSEFAQAAYLEWQRYLPLADASLLIEHESIDSSLPNISVNLGFIISKAVFDRLRDALPSGSQMLKPELCLYTFVKGPDDCLNDTARITDVLDWIVHNGYRLSGDPVTRMIATFDAGEGILRYDRAWFPVTKV